MTDALPPPSSSGSDSSSGENSEVRAPSEWGGETRADDTELEEVNPPGFDAGMQIGRYVVLGGVGEGGMGIVYAAYDPELDRKVALKLLHPTKAKSSEISRTRLLREAQAMARLNHPNVVTVHDVGELGKRVFLAMEFVEGQTLGDWQEQSRPWRETLATIISAGRGLEAAHAAGLVHRDFKPDNVMVSDTGRVVVMDFGIAQALENQTRQTQKRSPRDFEVEFAEAGLDDPSLLTDRGDAFSSVDGSRLTSTGAMIGTPLYMAPEQHLAIGTDARTDQFAFCLVLYAALYGQHAFEGNSRSSLGLTVTRGEVRPPPKGTKVPGWLHREILRGLAVNPADRHPSMTALLERLSDDPDARRRKYLVYGAGVLGVAALVAVPRLAEEDTTNLCTGAQQRVDAVWNDEAREAGREAFEATGLPFAAESWSRVVTNIDEYTKAWSGMYTENCEATRVEGVQSEALLDLRTACLDERLGQVEALAKVLENADIAVVEHAVEAAVALTPLTDCADAERLMAAVAPPDETIRPQVDAVRAMLADARAQHAAARFGAALETATEANQRAQEIDYPPLHAQTLLSLGFQQEETGDFAGAAESLEAALWIATANGQDQEIVDATSALTGVVGLTQAELEQGMRWGRHAQAAARRIGEDSLAMAEALAVTAALHQQMGELDEAERLALRVLELRQTHGEPDSLAVANALMALGTLENERARWDEALEFYGRAQVINEKLFGSTHPRVGTLIMNIGNVHEGRGDHEKAHKFHQRAVETMEKAYGADHPALAQALGNMGTALAGEGTLRRVPAVLRSGPPDLREGPRRRAPQRGPVSQQRGGGLRHARPLRRVPTQP